MYFNNEVVDASNDYVYDAVYRLLGATGREQMGLLREPGCRAHEEKELRRRPQPLPSDGRAMRRYEETYAYDAVGNLLEVVHAGSQDRCRRQYSYAESTNRLERTSVGEVEERYESDANGNMTRMPHLVRMDWDSKNQLQRTQRRVVHEGSAEMTYYVYDSGGQRVRKITERSGGEKARERIYLGGFELYREYSAEEVVMERETLHVMDDVQRVAMLETKTIDKKASGTMTPSTRTRYHFGNHLDSACLELDEAGKVLSYEEFYPYGGTSFDAAREHVDISPKRYRYLGKERDEETGLYALGARYYAAWLGRWTSADPKGMVDGTNVFAYCRGNPIALRDPNGTDAETSTAEDEAQACLVDPSVAPPTALEEEQQQTIVSEHPQTSFIGPPAPSTAAAPEETNPEQSAYAARVERYQSIFKEERGRGWWDSTFHINTREEREAHQWRAAQDCPECDPTASPEVIDQQLSRYRWGLGLIGAGNAAMQLSLSLPSPEVEPSQRIPIAAANAGEADTLAPLSSLSTRQAGIHELLPEAGSSTLLPKRGVSMNDLRSIGQVTGDEYNMFTNGAQRLVVRGSGNRVSVSTEMYDDIIAGRYGKYSGHTHPPGYEISPSVGDRDFLMKLGQGRSAVWGDSGSQVFGPTAGDDAIIQSEINRAMMIKLYGR